MNDTALLIATFLGLLLFSVMLWGVLLRIGLRWAGVPHVSALSVALVSVLAFLFQAACNLVDLAISGLSGATQIAAAVALIAAVVAVPCGMIMAVFKTSVRQAFKAWLPTLAAAAAMLAITHLVLLPFVYIAFSTPANSMAPTLLGPHWKGRCLECGRPNYCSAADPRRGGVAAMPMICDAFHITGSAPPEQVALPGDRFMVARFLSPRRWDIVVYRYPGDPSVMYVARIVGLPGETITVRDGAVYANDAPAPMPESLDGLRYELDGPAGMSANTWGSANRPAKLGDGEYFVLGDFSVRSRDSRWWERGADGHSAFAVPRSHLEGVVTHTFWPPSRWRIHR